MKLLSYQAKKFSWSAHSQTIQSAAPSSEGETADAAVIWLHEQMTSEMNPKRPKNTKAHKWIANNKSLKPLSSIFAHLGGDSKSR